MRVSTNQPLNIAALLAFAAISFVPRLALAQTAQNTVTQYTYDNLGNVLTVTDPLNRVTNLRYDVLARLDQITQPADASGARPVIGQDYDGADRLVTVKDPRALMITYSVDGLGNMVQLNSPDTGISSSTFDASGNVLTTTDARGRTKRLTYDALDRIRSISFDSGVPSLFEYDGGVGGTPQDVGKLTRMTDESGETRFFYDAMGRLQKKQQTTTIGGQTQVLELSYEYGTTGSANGKVIAMTYPSGRKVVYEYDSAGRISASSVHMSDSSGVVSTMPTPLIKEITYSSTGAVTGWKWGNDSPQAPNQMVRTYDLDGRLTSYTLGPQQSGGYQRELIYDAAGRITSYNKAGEAVGASSETFAYDALDRLKSVTAARGNETYNYDLNGNRTSAARAGGSSAYTTALGSNRLTSVTGADAQQFAYDLAGNRTRVTGLAGNVNFTYGDHGRMTTAARNGVNTQYLYNGRGERTLKAVGSTNTSVYLHAMDGKLIVAVEKSGAANDWQETIYLGNTPIGLMKGDQNLYYVFADHIETPRGIASSADNAIVWHWQADPFGRLQPEQVVGMIRYDQRFPGQQFDVETELHYNYFRDYDPQTGRYIQSDPIGLDGGLNTYAYVGGDPVSYYDAPGLNRTRAPTNGPTFYSAQVALITSQIQIYNPSFRYETARPSSGPGSGYTQSDVRDLARILRDHLRVAQRNQDISNSRMICESIPGLGGEKNGSRGDLPRRPGGDFAPHPGATGPHSTYGTRLGSDGNYYRQGATFDGNGNFRGRTDITDHGSPHRPGHVNPHHHPATGPGGVGPGVPGTLPYP